MDLQPLADASGAEPADVSSPPSAVKQQQKRTSRACLACRARKSKCTLDAQDGNPQPPCQRCKRDGKECVIGSSNRGGRRVRRSTLAKQNSTDSTPNARQKSEPPPAWAPNSPTTDKVSQLLNHISTGPSPHSGPSQTQLPLPSPGFPPLLHTQQQSAHPLTSLPPVDQISSHQAVNRPYHAPTMHMNMPPPSTVVAAMADQRSDSDDVPFNDLQNPSDALDILAHIASNGGNHENNSRWNGNSSRPSFRQGASYGSANGRPDFPDYRPVSSGALTVQRLLHVIDRYHRLYHPYFPLVPRETLEPSNLPHIIEHEPHLLTAILVIASKDMMQEPHIFSACAEHMRSLVSNLAAGGPGGVEAVEALLLLAEWTPYTSKSQAGQVGRGEEDREAWMHVGLCLRLGYFLGLDKYSFRVQGGNDPQAARKRLVWTACFISDRQISIRVGRGFWSRGPGPLTILKKEDFQSLTPQQSGEDDYSTIFQATLELTQIFSNVHDVLYSNPSGVRSHLSGGYIKFIDDFRSAIYSWNSVYGTLACSHNIKATLVMSYDYLRLYTNAFAFHATIQRALPKNAEGKPTFSRVFHNDIGSVGDARFIYEGLDAAKSLLTTMNNFVDARESLRYMPLRFYLYCVYAGVFLYRARTVGVMSPEEDAAVKRIVSQTVTKLEQSSVGEAHPGFRYSQLLRLLWDRAERRPRKDAASIAAIIDPYRPGASSVHSNPAATPRSGSSLESPAMQEQMGNFSWADLDAVGDFAVNGSNAMGQAENDWWSAGFLPAADSNHFATGGQGSGMGMAMGVGNGWEGNVQ